MISNRNEKGQAILLVVVAMALFLIGALGLAMDISQLFAHQQMAQVAADAAAEAEMMSIFQGTSGALPAGSGNCGALPAKASSGCKYAQMNGFGGSSDVVTVTVSCIAAPPLPQLPCPSNGTPNQVTVAITRTVSNTLIRMVGGSPTSNISATGIAATVSIVEPTPILVLHPNMSGALSGNGNTKIIITGGPSRSIQVNSSDSNAFAGVGSINLSCAGPDGNGADLGVFGGPPASAQTITNGACTSTLSGYNFGTAGQYRQPASPLKDPLLFVQAPGAAVGDPTTLTAPVPTKIVMPNKAPFPNPNYGCPAGTTCHVYSPGLYANGINVKNDNAIFQPGVYVMLSGKGFGTAANGNATMCIVGASDVPTGATDWPSPGSGCVTDPRGQTGDGMLVYNSGGGTFSVGGNGAVHLLGTPQTDGSGNPTRFAGMLFFQDRTALTITHRLGGTGCLDLVGTIYTTNTVATIISSGYSQFQTIEYHGKPCSSTNLLGEIITDVLTMKGTPTLGMRLSPTGFLHIEQVALIGGGPHS